MVSGGSPAARGGRQAASGGRQATSSGSQAARGGSQAVQSAGDRKEVEGTKVIGKGVDCTVVDGKEVEGQEVGGSEVEGMDMEGMGGRRGAGGERRGASEDVLRCTQVCSGGGERGEMDDVADMDVVGASVSLALIDEAWRAVLERMVATEGIGSLRSRHAETFEWLAVGVELGRKGCAEADVVGLRAIIDARRFVVANGMLRARERKRPLRDIVRERVEGKRLRRGLAITLSALGKVDPRASDV